MNKTYKYSDFTPMPKNLNQLAKKVCFDTHIEWDTNLKYPRIGNCELKDYLKTSGKLF